MEVQAKLKKRERREIRLLMEICERYNARKQQFDWYSITNELNSTLQNKYPGKYPGHKSDFVRTVRLYKKWKTKPSAWKRAELTYKLPSSGAVHELAPDTVDNNGYKSGSPSKRRRTGPISLGSPFRTNNDLKHNQRDAESSVFVEDEPVTLPRPDQKSVPEASKPSKLHEDASLDIPSALSKQTSPNQDKYIGVVQSENEGNSGTESAARSNKKILNEPGNDRKHEDLDADSETESETEVAGFQSVSHSSTSLRKHVSFQDSEKLLNRLKDRTSIISKSRMLAKSTPFPFTCGEIKVVSLGSIAPFFYHDENYIYPVGLKTVVTFDSMFEAGKQSLYSCTIVNGQTGPIFAVTNSRGDRFWDRSPEMAWKRVATKSSNSISLPQRCYDLFGIGVPNVRYRIQGLKGSSKCLKYKFKNLSGLVDLPFNERSNISATKARGKCVCSSALCARLTSEKSVGFLEIPAEAELMELKMSVINQLCFSDSKDIFKNIKVRIALHHFSQDSFAFCKSKNRFLVDFRNIMAFAWPIQNSPKTTETIFWDEKLSTSKDSQSGASSTSRIVDTSTDRKRVFSAVSKIQSLYAKSMEKLKVTLESLHPQRRETITIDE
mmetsp:Transcript_3128/g.4205  ORF Transcript_3128/g.4205 Transcript_3128/m.4205 type:complete len:608 (-) Transcript_3128:2378-4201(-)